MWRPFVFGARGRFAVPERTQSTNERAAELLQARNLALLIGDHRIEVVQKVFLMRQFGLNFYESLLVHRHTLIASGHTKATGPILQLRTSRMVMDVYPLRP
jgi:hypothetical protein